MVLVYASKKSICTCYASVSLLRHHSFLRVYNGYAKFDRTEESILYPCIRSALALGYASSSPLDILMYVESLERPKSLNSYNTRSVLKLATLITATLANMLL